MKTFLKQSYSQQLASILNQLIESGQWAQGMKVPSIREVASEFDVGLTTAYQALRSIEDAGLIHRPVPGGLAYVQGTGQGQLKGGDAKGSAASIAPSVATLNSSSRQTKKRSHIALIGSAVNIGPVVDSDTWNARLVDAVERAVLSRQQDSKQHHFLTRISSSNTDRAAAIDESIEQLRALASDISGAVVLVANHPMVRGVLDELDALDIPWVSINRPVLDMTHNFVSANNLAAGRLIGRCFTLMGYERVLILSPDLRKAISWTQKASGIVDAYLLNQKPIHGIEYVSVEGLQNNQPVIDAITQYIKRSGPPQAIFATGDQQAMFAIQACQQQGLSVPDDVVVVGSTGLDAAAYTHPSLTLVSQPLQAMGQNLVDMLFDMMDTGARRCPGREIAGELIVRESMPIAPHIIATLQKEGLLPAAHSDMDDMDNLALTHHSSRL